MSVSVETPDTDGVARRARGDRRRRVSVRRRVRHDGDPCGRGLACAEALPVGGAIARAREAVGIDEGFEEEWPGAVGRLPVVRQLAGRARENRAGQERHLHPGQDQEPAVIDHAGQVGGPLRIGPANPAIPRGQLPGGARPEQTRHEGGGRGARVDTVPELRADRYAEAQIVIAIDQLGPAGTVAGGRHHGESKRGEVAHAARDRGGRVTGGGPDDAPRALRAGRAERGQRDEPAVVEAREPLSTFVRFQAAGGAGPVEQLADGAGDGLREPGRPATRQPVSSSQATRLVRVACTSRSYVGAAFSPSRNTARQIPLRLTCSP